MNKSYAVASGIKKYIMKIKLIIIGAKYRYGR